MCQQGCCWWFGVVVNVFEEHSWFLTVTAFSHPIGDGKLWCGPLLISLSLQHRTKAFRCCTKCSVLSFNLTTLLVFENHLMALYCFVPSSAQKPSICKVVLSLLAIWPDTYYCFVFCFFQERSLSLWCFLDPSYFLLFRLIILSQGKMLESLKTPAAKTLWRV